MVGKESASAPRWDPRGITELGSTESVPESFFHLTVTDALKSYEKPQGTETPSRSYLMMAMASFGSYDVRHAGSFRPRWG